MLFQIITIQTTLMVLTINIFKIQLNIMKFNKHIFFTILFALFLGIGITEAQVRVVNEDGDVIILMPDGNWRYEDDKKEAKRVDKSAPLPKNTVPVSQKSTKKEPKTNTKDSDNKKVTPKKTSTKSSKKTTVKSKPKKSKKAKKQKATVYAVPKRERKIKSPVIPEYNCEYSMKERDEFTNKLKIAMKPQVFFSYTQKDLKPFLREKDYLTCTGYLSSVLGMTILNIRFEMESTMAQQEYGEIVAGTQLLVKLLDGEMVVLNCQESDKGMVDEVNGKTIYRTYFSLDKLEMKRLQKSEVVSVRMLWSFGYEDYNVNELDFFINQLDCLEQVKQ
jgi:hypothetical protein